MKVLSSFLLIIIFNKNVISQVDNWHLQFWKGSKKVLVQFSADDKYIGEDLIPDSLDFIGTYPDSIKLFTDFIKNIYLETKNNNFKKTFFFKLSNDAFIEQVRFVSYYFYFLVNHDANTTSINPRYSLIRFNYKNKHCDTLYYKQRKNGIIRLISISPDNLLYSEIIEKLKNEDVSVMQILNVKKLFEETILFSDTTLFKKNERLHYDEINTMNFDDNNNLYYLKEYFMKKKEVLYKYSFQERRLFKIFENNKICLSNNGFILKGNRLYTTNKNEILRFTVTETQVLPNPTIMFTRQ